MRVEWCDTTAGSAGQLAGYGAGSGSVGVGALKSRSDGEAGPASSGASTGSVVLMGGAANSAGPGAMIGAGA